MPIFPKSPCDVTESIKSFEEALISIAPFTASKLAKDAGEDAEDIKDVIDEDVNEELAEAYKVINK